MKHLYQCPVLTAYNLYAAVKAHSVFQQRGKGNLGLLLLKLSLLMSHQHVVTTPWLIRSSCHQRMESPHRTLTRFSMKMLWSQSMWYWKPATYRALSRRVSGANQFSKFTPLVWYYQCFVIEGKNLPTLAEGIGMTYNVPPPQQGSWQDIIGKERQLPVSCNQWHRFLLDLQMEIMLWLNLVFATLCKKFCFSFCYKSIDVFR